VITSGLCTYNELLWELSWVNVEMMIRDAVRTDYKSKDKEAEKKTMTDEELFRMLGQG
jgi:predicted nucleic acid-binding protein